MDRQYKTMMHHTCLSVGTNNGPAPEEMQLTAQKVQVPLSRRQRDKFVTRVEAVHQPRSPAEITAQRKKST